MYSWISLTNPRANFTVINVKHAVYKLMYTLVMCQQRLSQMDILVIFIMQYGCLLLRITNAFFNEIVLESKVLNVFGIKMRQCNSENINYSAKSVAGYDTECVPKRWFKELHNRDNTDIYKVLQIKSYSLEYFSSSESKICKKRCLRWFICSRNTNLPEELRRSWPYFAFYEMQNHWLYKNSPQLRTTDYSCTFISQKALLRIHYIASEKYTLLF